MPYGDAPMRFGKPAALLAGVIIAAGCDCNRTTAQIQASHVMVATVLATPEIVIPREAIAGFEFDASIPFFDGGLPSFDGGCPFVGGCAFDAGSIPVSFDGNAIRLEPQTLVGVFFGRRESATSAPTPVDGVTVTVSNGVKTFMLKSQGSGTHALTSQDDSTLTYDAGVDWTFTATSSGADYIGELQDTPEAERVVQLHPDAGYIDIAANTEYLLTRPEPPLGQDRLLGFVTVVPIAADGQQGNPTYSNVKFEPIELIRLVAAPSPWKASVVRIPPEAFPEADTNYLIILQSARLGFASSANLFIGSAMIAGVADVGVVKTRK
jgi:hypothetical protein